MDEAERLAAIRSQRQRTERTERLWVADQWRDFEVLRVPINLLVLNVENRRFAAERRYFEARLNRAFDPENVEADAESIESILLDSSASRRLAEDRVIGTPSKDTQALEADWQNRRQERPLWIRPDGTVHNGNRRLAMVRRRRRKHGEDGNTWVDAVIIDDTIDELTLFRMEQHEQLTEDYKVLYTDINLLLAIRDAAEVTNIDWGDDTDITRVANELSGVIGNNKIYAIIQLNAIKYMDAFLDDNATPGAYELLMGQIERFRDIGKAMRTVRDLAPEREDDMLEVCFAAIRTGLPHGDIRDIKRMFIKDRERFDQLVAQIRDDEAGWEPAGSESIHPPDSGSQPERDDSDDTDETDLDDDDDEPPGPNMADYEPDEQVRRTFDNHLDGYRASTGTDVLRLLAEVRNRLETLASADAQLLQDALNAEVKGVKSGTSFVIDWVDQYRHLVR